MSALTSERPDHDQFEATYVKYFPLLTQVAMFKFQVPDTEAETLVHDVLLSYLRKGATVIDLRPWLIGAICHASRHYWRLNGRIIGADPDAELDRVDPTTLHILDSLPNQIAARQAIESLSPRCQQILHMRFFEGCTVPEIAVRLGVKAKYASKLLTKCLRRVEKLFAEKGRTQ